MFAFFHAFVSNSIESSVIYMYNLQSYLVKLFNDVLPESN